MMRSIQRTFPLFVTALLLAVAILQLTIGYGEVRQASRSVADARLRFVDSVLVELFQSSQQRARITALAKDSAIVAFLRSGGQRGREQALAALRRITLDTASNARLTISPSDRPVVFANERIRRINSWESFTVKATLVSPIGTGCFKRRACCR